ncbi:MAG: hypothetical protein H6Q75_411 [Firmicutes bacterium]|nr:hypothetical protein [Bacillota bacterium]
MKLAEVNALLCTEVLCGQENMEREIVTACGADLMSDVLVYTKEKTLLLTGLTNIQVVRTAEVGDLMGIIFVRGKRPGPEVIEMAKAKSIPLMLTELSMFDACGILHDYGIRGCVERVPRNEL